MSLSIGSPAPLKLVVKKGMSEAGSGFFFVGKPKRARAPRKTDSHSAAFSN